MSDNRSVTKAGKANNRRIIKMAPMTRAVRSVLAVSAMTIALGGGGQVAAANVRAPDVHVLQVSKAAIDMAPVYDLTAIAITDPDDIAIDNADGITESATGTDAAAAIFGYSTAGGVTIHNADTGVLVVDAEAGSTIGIYGYSLGGVGNVSIDNAGDITATSVDGLADGIFAYGAQVDVANSGAMEVVGATWAAGIEAQAVDTAAVQNDGSIVAVATGAGATAFGIYATGSSITVGNSGDIAAVGFYAFGVEAKSYGDVSVTNSGNVSAGLRDGDSFYSAEATGIDATSGGEGAVVSVTNTGTVNANGFYNSTGIAAVSSGTGGSASVDNSGTIYVSNGYKYGTSASGIVVSADADAAITNSGSVTVNAQGTANGLVAMSFAGNASVTNSGDITVDSEAAVRYGAYGLVAFAGYGQASASNSGAINVTTKYIGVGMDVAGLDDVTVNNDGDITVDAYAAYGIRAIAGTGDVNVSNTGTITTTYGQTFGILGVSTEGAVNISNAGSITQEAEKQAIGVFARAINGDSVSVENTGTIASRSSGGAALAIYGNANNGDVVVNNGGSINVYSYNSAGYGILTAGDTTTVTNSGDISVDARVSSAGIKANGYHGATVNSDGGTIDVFATYQALGIRANAYEGDAVVNSTSTINVASLQYYATGIVATSAGANASANNGGEVTVLSMNGLATGVGAYSIVGNASIVNSGNVQAYSQNNSSFALNAYTSYGAAAITNTGAVSATAYMGDAIGVYGYSLEGDVAINNAGDIYAASFYGLADGIFASGANVVVTNSGKIETHGTPWSAGIEAQGADSVVVNNSGEINANAGFFWQLESVDPEAVLGSSSGGTGYGIYATAGEGGASVTNTGAITVMGGLANGIEVRSYGDLVINNSGDITAGKNLSYDAETYPGYVLFYGSQVATGINASSNGENANVLIKNSGDLTVGGVFSATGIAAVATGMGGAATVINTGNIYATQDVPSGIGAEGIVVSADGAAQIDNSGNIVVKSQYAASGLTALSFAGDVVVVNSGDVSVNNYAQQGNPGSGIVAFAGYGNASAANSGDILVESFLAAYGMDVSARYDVVVSNGGGSITAGALGGAIGIKASSTLGDITISNASAITVAGAVYGGLGIQAIAQLGDVAVSNSAEINANGLFEKGVGIYASGGTKTTVVNTGDINAYSGYDRAIGIAAFDTYTAEGFLEGTTTVTNTGNITLNAPYGGLGQTFGIIADRSYGEIVVNNSGNITSTAGGRGYGVYAHVNEGNVSLTNTGDVSMASPTDAVIGLQIATGNFFFGGGDATLKNSGDIDVYSGFGIAVGMGAIAGSVMDPHGDAYILNVGDVDVISQYMGYGIQIRATSGVGTVINTGDIKVNTYAYYNAQTPGKAMGIGAINFGDGEMVIKNAGDLEIHGYVGAYGLYARSEYKADIAITNAGNVNVSSDYTLGRGVFTQNLYGTTTVNNAAGGKITATGGQGAFGVHTLSVYGDVTINNAGLIEAKNSEHAAGVVMTGIYGTSTLNNFAGGIVRAEGAEGVTFAVVGSEAVEIINNSGTISGGLLMYGGDDVVNNKAGGLWDIGGTISTDLGEGDDVINNLAGGTIRLNNGVLTLGGSTAAGNAFNNTGTINVMGDSVIDMGGISDAGSPGPVAPYGALSPLAAFAPTAIVGPNALAFNNSGTINMVDGATDDSLTIVGGLTGTGALNIDMDISTLSADHLLITGDVSSTAKQKVNVQFSGVPTSATTKVDFAFIDGNWSASNFEGGEVLNYDPNSNFLTFGLDVSNAHGAAGEEIFSVSMNVTGLSQSGSMAASASTGAAAFMNSQVGTFRQRLGVNPYGDSGKVMSAFVRFFTGSGNVSPTHSASNFGQAGAFDYEQSQWGREFGINANLYGNFHAGLVLGKADGRQSLNAGGADNRMNGATVGGYATWYDPNGLYVDLSVRKMAADMVLRSSAGAMDARARSSALSLEAGYSFDVAGTNIISQVQYTQTKVESIKAFNGAALGFTLQGETYARARAGVELNRVFQSGDVRWTPYGSLNVVRDISGDSRFVVGNFHGSSNIKGTSTMAEIGLGMEKGGFGVTLGGNWVDGGAFKSTYGGQVNFRYSW